MAILASEKVLTLDYWKLAHDLKVGDVVFDSCGKPRKVTVVQEYQTEHCYRISFNDHLMIGGDKHLKFAMENRIYRSTTHRYKGLRKRRVKPKEISVEELTTQSLLDKHERTKYSVPNTEPIQLPHQTLPVPPFIFGYWFISKRKDKTMAPPLGCESIVHEEFRNHGYKVIEKYYLKKNGRRTFKTIPTVDSHLIPNIPTSLPNNYLLASVEQRIELLRGILYGRSRHYNKKRKLFRISGLSNSKLLTQIQQLIESLGHSTRMELDSVVFKSMIKLMEEQEISKTLVHYGRRFIKSIRKLPSQLCVHIETDGEDNSLLVGEGFIPCH